MSDENIGWLPIEDLEKDMNENRLETTDELKGRAIKLFSEDGQVISLQFDRQGGVSLKMGTEAAGPIREACEAFCVMPEIYFVDFVIRKTKSSVSIILDFSAMKSVILMGKLSEEKARQDLLSRSKAGLDLSPMEVNFIHAHIDLPPESASIVPYGRTRDLIGKRVKYVYSKTHTYEHLYLNDRFFTWHCLSGPEKGLADTERCDCFKITPDLYLFTWREKIIPTLGVVLINTKMMKTTGKLFGIDMDTGKITNVTMGAHAALLNITTYD